MIVYERFNQSRYQYEWWEKIGTHYYKEWVASFELSPEHLDLIRAGIRNDGYKIRPPTSGLETYISLKGLN